MIFNADGTVYETPCDRCPHRLHSEGCWTDGCQCGNDNWLGVVFVLEFAVFAALPWVWAAAELVKVLKAP